MEFYTISTPVQFEDNGVTKTKWLLVGSLNKTTNGQMFITLNQNPHVKYMAFKQDAAKPARKAKSK